MYVIGTAGHVDHGKSTIVQALTGIDPDRLQEEKERGLTIDLGFAWLRLPGGNEVSIVDVPGHERFVNNMLAGVGGIDLALLVVAADESVMPQTREHLAILDLLNIRRGLVALTKKDLVDDDWLALVTADVEEVLKGTTLEGVQVVPVSGKTGEGLPELVSAIEALLQETETRQDLGRPRLPIDRSFTMSGFGTIVTGTLIDGGLNVGQQVALVPAGRTSRVRGLQTHRQKLEQASPGRRVAANLTGIAHEDISRGDVLTTSGWLKPTTAVDVHLKVIADAPRPIRHNMFATVHTGSSETVARVRLLEKQVAEPGESTWAQLKLDRPVAVVKGDYFVVRSNQTTLGGGNVVDPHAPTAPATVPARARTTGRHGEGLGQRRPTQKHRGLRAHGVPGPGESSQPPTCRCPGRAERDGVREAGRRIEQRGDRQGRIHLYRRRMVGALRQGPRLPGRLSQAVPAQDRGSQGRASEPSRHEPPRSLAAPCPAWKKTKSWSRMAPRSGFRDTPPGSPQNREERSTPIWQCWSPTPTLRPQTRRWTWRC